MYKRCVWNIRAFTAYYMQVFRSLKKMQKDNIPGLLIPFRLGIPNLYFLISPHGKFYNGRKGEGEPPKREEMKTFP